MKDGPQNECLEDDVSTKGPEDGRWGYWALIFMSVAICCFFLVLSQALNWSDWMAGARNGFFHLAFLIIPVTIFSILWVALIFVVYKWRAWKRFRTVWALLLSGLVGVAVLIGIFTSPLTPESRFEKFTHVKFPANADDIHCTFSGGGIADYTDTYYFKTTSDEVDRLISEMGLKERVSWSAVSQDREMNEPSGYRPIQVLPGCPDPYEWDESSFYEGWGDRQHWFYLLLTNRTKTEVYLMVGCI